MHNKNKNFIVISLGWLGDTLLNSTLCQDIKKNFPDSKLYFIASKPFKEVAIGIPGVDEVFEYDKNDKNKGFLGIFEFAKDFPHKNNIDCAFVTHSHERSVLLSWAIGAKRRISAGLKGLSPVNLLITDKFKFTNDEIRTTYKGDFNSDYLKVIGADARLNPVRFEVEQEAKNAVKEKLSKKGLNDHDYVVLSPLSKDEWKDWTIENVREFIHECPQKVVLVGTKPASDMAVKMRNLDFIDLTNQTTIFELAALMQGAKATVTVDTGTMHISYACGAQTICLFFNDKMIDEWYPKNYKNVFLIQGKKTHNKKTKVVTTEQDITASNVLSVLDKILKGEENAV